MIPKLFFTLSDTKKLDCWETIVESDIQTMEWFDSEDSGEEDEEDSEDDDMDTDWNQHQENISKSIFLWPNYEQ